MHLVRKFASKVNYSFIYCLPLGFAFAAAPVYLEEGRFIFTAGFIPLAFLHCAGFMLLDFIMRFLIMKAAEKSNTIETPGIFDRFMNLPVSVLFIGLLIFICWLPSLIALYPGTVINDTWG